MIFNNLLSLSNEIIFVHEEPERGNLFLSTLPWWQSTASWGQLRRQAEVPTDRLETCAPKTRRLHGKAGDSLQVEDTFSKFN